MDFDRTKFIPPHTGDSILPLSPFFTRLVRYAHCRPPRLAIRDVNLGIEKTYLDLLSDALAVRKVLRESLSPDALSALENGKETYVGLLAAGGYEYAVGFIAILALGAAVVPMAVVLPVDEASYFVIKARCAAILTSTSAHSLAQAVVSKIHTTDNTDIPCLEIAPHLPPSPLPARSILLSTDHFLDDNAPGVVIFTSGTTGRPKGAVMRRAFLHDTSQSVADHYRISENDVILHLLPVHHATGVGINFVPYILSGACIEFRSGSFDAAWTWERLKQGGLTVFSAVPTIYMRMMRYFEKHLAILPQEEVDKYIAGARGFRIMLCGTSTQPTPVQQFWTNLLGGKRILTRYGATEIGATFKTPLCGDDVPDASVGPVFPGVTVKLSEGDEGEILIKSPFMFSKYLNDEAATASAHTSDGFYKTGDLAQRRGENYFILGRASLDIIKSGGYKISALDIEREILGLRYIAEVMVVGVADEEFGQRVGAVVSLRDDQMMYRCAGNGGVGKELSLDDLRSDIRSKLAGYKLPTLLRVVEGELPKSATGKVVKKLLGPKLFPREYRDDPEVQVWVNRKGARL
ncbi:hypothetical protein AJ80_09758 [Polytolypa hystricis UAMH7299]|uniref:AMP-dependent synthetase/ligase domain-containing protein n=1 Tax=Polytolypa hystricis (strain UAMH7299) TaxID=1447883 RepID=A0A2B7WJQ8_POLH7|nr:hypothetical protein AJ80_09758 [Polytolypa hystricis UAMH7299]